MRSWLIWNVCLKTMDIFRVNVVCHADGGLGSGVHVQECRSNLSKNVFLQGEIWKKNIQDM